MPQGPGPTPTAGVGTGRGCRDSVGHDLPADRVRSRGLALIEAIGSPLDVLAHSEDSWPSGILRFAVEYDDGVQLDLVAIPAAHRPGLPDGSVALADKDGRLASSRSPPVASVDPAQAREWSMLGWWAVSNVAKYLRRGSLFEAVEALREARTQGLRLFAAGRRIPYPSFGLTSLLDVEPFELPDRLGATYATPTEPADVLHAAWAVADLLDTCAREGGEALGVDLTTPWADIARSRLRAADPRR